MFVSNGSLVTTKTPVNFTTSSWFPSMPSMSSARWPNAYGGMYERQLWVYVVVSKRARATARLPLPVYEHDELNRPRADEHPLAKLLRQPNPGLSPFKLWQWTSSTYDTWGDTAWLKRRARTAPAGLYVYPLHPAYLHHDEDKDRWSFDNGKLKLDNIPREDLVLFTDFHPSSLTRGLSPLEPLRATLENEWSARSATSSFWRRGSRPGTALVHPKNLSEAAMKRLKAQYDEASAGPGNTGATIVFEEGMEPKRLDLTAEEAQYIETRKLNREEVCAAYDIPPPVVHILDRATFSNITEQMRSMYRDTMAPHLRGFEAAIETDLRMVEWPSDDVYAEFLMDEVLRGDFETRQDALNKATHMTLAEKRKVDNLPHIPGTDRLFLPAGVLPLDAIDAQAAASPGGDQVAAVIPMSVARSVLGRLSWQQSLDDVSEAALIEGLNGHASTVKAAVAAQRTNGGDVASLRALILAMAKE